MKLVSTDYRTQVTSTQKVASDAQIEKMEKELAKMRAGLDESVQLMEQREMTTNIEWASSNNLLEYQIANVFH